MSSTVFNLNIISHHCCFTDPTNPLNQNKFSVKRRWRINDPNRPCEIVSHLIAPSEKTWATNTSNILTDCMISRTLHISEDFRTSDPSRGDDEDGSANNSNGSKGLHAR